MEAYPICFSGSSYAFWNWLLCNEREGGRGSQCRFVNKSWERGVCHVLQTADVDGDIKLNPLCGTEKILYGGGG